VRSWTCHQIARASRIPKSLERTSDKEPSIPNARGAMWPRALLEGVIIVLSILLAFGVQASWESYQERRQEREYLSALREELRRGLGIQADRIAVLGNSLRAHESLIGQFGAGERAPADSLIYWLSELSRPNQFSPPTAVLEDIVSSGGIQLIKDHDLRLAVAEYDRALTNFERVADQAWATWSERIQPFLEGEVPRVDRLRLGSFNSGGQVPFEPAPFPSNYDGIFRSPAFQSMIAERWIRTRSSLTTLEDIARRTTDLIAMIDDALGSA